MADTARHMLHMSAAEADPRTFDRGRVGRRLVYGIMNELYATLTIAGPFAIIAYLMG